MPRLNSISVQNVAGHTTYEFTALGITELAQLATIGTPLKEIAAYFGVSTDWVTKQMRTNPQVQEIYEASDAGGRKELREKLHEIALAGDPQILKFLGERRLGMRREEEKTINHNINVIGTMPDSQLKSDGWLEKFAPPEALEAPEPIDAEYSDLDELGEKKDT